MRIVYVNGQWRSEAEAHVSVFDRGFLFADGIYEVAAVVGGKLIDYDGHAARLGRSLAALNIPAPLPPDALLAVHREIIARNDLGEGLVYLQVTRGSADRDFLMPANVPPTLVLFTQMKRIVDNPKLATGLSAICVPDRRWGLRDIKTVQLLYASMVKTEAARAGADDAILTEDGVVTEASSANVYIVTGDGTLVTRGLSRALLPGITRASVLDLAERDGIRCQQRSFTVDEMKAAREVFITSATSFVMPVARIDGEAIGAGTPGPVTHRVRALYIAHSLATAI